MEHPELHVVLLSSVSEYIGLRETEPPHVIQEEIQGLNTPTMERVHGHGSSLDRLAESYTSDCEESPHTKDES